MIKDMTLGQFFPGNSAIHRLDPRAKIVASIVFVTAVFAAENLFSFLLLFLLTAVLTFLSEISFTVILRGIRPVVAILIFTALLSILFTQGKNGETALLEFGILHIYTSGLLRAGVMVMRVVLLIVMTSLLLTYTTSPIRLTDALESLFSPLAKLGVPVSIAAMTMSIALRFIPTFVEETDKIMSAQKARGASFSSGGLISRAKALLPILIPLITSAFRRAEELAVAMECRCYRGGDGRTKMNELHFTARDLMFLLLSAVLTAGVFLLNAFLPIGALL